MTHPTLWPTARQTDPDTSHDAARTVDAATVTDAIVHVLAATDIPLIGDEIASRLPRWNDGTVKTALSRLWRAGLVVKCGARAPGPGRPRQTEWALSASARRDGWGTAPVDTGRYL